MFKFAKDVVLGIVGFITSPLWMPLFMAATNGAQVRKLFTTMEYRG